MFSIFEYDFMIRAFIAGFAIALMAPVIGSFLIAKKYSMLSDTLAHISLFGISLGTLVGFNPIWSAIFVSSFAGIGIEKLREQKMFSGDLILALFLSGGLGFSLVISSMISQNGFRLMNFLFGSIITVSSFDVILILSLAVVSIFTIYLFYKELFLVSLDNELALASGINVKFFNILLIVLSAFCVSVSIKIVGALLIGALIVLPVMSAKLFKISFGGTIILAIIFSVISVFGGLCVSYYFGLPSGGAIVILAICLFLGAMFFKRN